MSSGLYVQPHGNLLFHWERPRRRKLAIAGFLVASVGLHAFCFLLFQVIYPPTISLLPPPARVSLIAPNSEDGRNFLHWLAAEDPALTSETQRPADARAYQLPRLSHIPSYVAVPPSLKPLPSVAENVAEPTSLPPGMVTVKTPTAETPPVVAPSTLLFSSDLAWSVTRCSRVLPAMPRSMKRSATSLRSPVFAPTPSPLCLTKS